jgi:two-component sensor histidine kinase/integral membrane sensor domain MASE1
LPTQRIRDLTPGDLTPGDLTPRARDLPALAGLAAAYAAGAWVGLQWAILPGGGSPIWPGAGVAFAGLVIGGPRLWPAIVAGRLAVALATGSPQPLWADLAVAAIAAAAAVVPALIVRRSGGLDPRLGSLRDVGRLILIGGVLGAPISGLGALIAWAAGAPTHALPALLENWIPGFLAGVLLAAPLTFTLARWRHWRISTTRGLHLLACLTVTGLIAAHVFLQPTAAPIGTWQVYPPLVWAALAFSAQGASAALIVVAVFGVTGAMQGVWPASHVAESSAERMLMVQEFLGASALTMLVLGAVADERRAKHQIEESERRLAEGLAAQAAVAEENARLYAAAQREIEERRRAEEHQKLLINELNHRVKNTLATVQSIAAQTRRTAKDPKASYEAFIERLMALSRVHDVLTHERWERAALRAIVDGATQPFEDGTGRRFRISGPPVWIEPHAALALAMALHELATNAAKYGALSVAEGVVTLEWRLAEGPGEVLELAWREAGGPPVRPPKQRGFGSRLLERGLAGELNGEVSVDYRPDGLACTMRARLRAAEARPEPPPARTAAQVAAE